MRDTIHLPTGALAGTEDGLLRVGHGDCMQSKVCSRWIVVRVCIGGYTMRDTIHLPT